MLGTLPKNMKEIYDIIYEMILEEQSEAQITAISTFKILISAYRPLPLTELLSSLGRIGIKGFQDFEALLKICHNLIALDRITLSCG